ncbi:hypothetical protein ppKF707_5084 [Metapseudomonas furukawaii]|nr:hypothetical protein ppKF707_5084 [Pseudomonas furukawaii]
MNAGPVVAGVCRAARFATGKIMPAAGAGARHGGRGLVVF